jgi:hypothetical protein
MENMQRLSQQIVTPQNVRRLTQEMGAKSLPTEHVRRLTQQIATALPPKHVQRLSSRSGSTIQLPGGTGERG